MTSRSRMAWVMASLTILAGCSSSGARGQAPYQSNSLVPTVRHRPRPNALPIGNYIKHIVIVIQENRSFDNIFSGYPGADGATFGYMHGKNLVPLRPVDFESSTADLPHSLKQGLTDYDNGAMDGYDLSAVQTGLAADIPYHYVERNEVAPYWSMAEQYVLADRMFQTEWGGSFTAHLNLIAGTASLSPTLTEADNPSAQPWGCDAPVGTASTTWSSSDQLSIKGPFPCFTQFNTLADSLDNAGVSWKYYAPQISGAGGIWSEFDAIQAVRYGSDWGNNVISPETTVLTDASGGKLATVSWVVPDYLNSDHPGSQSATGPSWVASIVNAIGASQYWQSTAIIILWDDWGGWYDHVPPPQLDYKGLGSRIPCIIISPYSRAHYVTHQQYESGSILRLVEQTFNLPSLGYTDARANSLTDGFDFTQAPRTFSTISAPYSRAYILKRRHSLKPPDTE